MVIVVLILLSSCASLHENLSKNELEKAVHAKIDSREYRIDLRPQEFPRGDGTYLYIPEYFKVCGDSIISCMIYDNPFPGTFPPKNYIQHMRSVKYKILDYEQKLTRRGRRIVSFWFNITNEYYDPYLLTKYKDRLYPLHFKLNFSKTTKVRVIQNEFLRFGTLSL